MADARTSGDSAGLVALLGVFLACAALGVFAAESRRGGLLAVMKPLTTALLLAVVGVPHASFARWISLGIVLSLLGDIALLSSSNRAFMVGLVVFLVAHVLYTIAFVSKAHLDGAVVLYGAGVALAMSLLLRRLWRGAAGLRAPVAVYAAAIATMTVSAFATTTDQPHNPVAARLAAVGALLFLVSDAALALSKFERPFPRAAVLTLGVYWLGQLGIALAARLAL